MNVEIKIKKMKESSGNQQFYVGAWDLDKESDLFDSNCLNFSCHQSKYFDMETKEPVERATYDAIQLLKFFGKKEEDLVLLGLTEEEEKVVSETFKFWRFEK